jgi:hypothetical protein
MGRILITGPSGSGKTYLADALGLIEDAAVWHTDDAAKLGWSEASEEVAGWFDRPGPWIIEGVAVPRALRKWKGKHSRDPVRNVLSRLSYAGEPPCTQLIVLRHRRPEAGPAKAGHEAMAKGLFKVLDEVLEGWPELRKVTVYR